MGLRADHSAVEHPLKAGSMSATDQYVAVTVGSIILTRECDDAEKEAGRLGVGHNVNDV